MSPSDIHATEPSYPAELSKSLETGGFCEILGVRIFPMSASEQILTIHNFFSKMDFFNRFRGIERHLLRAIESVVQVFFRCLTISYVDLPHGSLYYIATSSKSEFGRTSKSVSERYANG